MLGSLGKILVFLGVPGKHCLNVSIKCHSLPEINHRTNSSESARFPNPSQCQACQQVLPVFLKPPTPSLR